MKRLTTILVAMALLMALPSQAQKDWSKVDFAKEYDATFKINGKTSKSLKANKTFVRSYAISQASLMKGSQTTSALQSGNRGTVYSRATIVGVNQDDYQQMVDELYQELMDELSAAGLKMTDGEDVLASAYAQKQLAKGSDKIHIGNTGANPAYEGKKTIDRNSIFGYVAGAGAVRTDVSFPPRNTNVYLTTKQVYGNFYQYLADKEGYNLLSINFYVAFASFDGGVGYKDVKISTRPVITLNSAITLTNPKGYGYISYKKDIWDDGNAWATDMKKIKSGEYEIIVDSDAYIAEVRSIISNLQKDIVKNINASMK